MSPGRSTAGLPGPSLRPLRRSPRRPGGPAPERVARGGDRRALSLLPQPRQPRHRLARGRRGATTRRRRSCPACGRRFTTVEEAVLAVVKRSGVTEPFNRTKVMAGVRRACQGRPVGEDQLQLLAQQVEDAVRATGAAEVPSHEVGLAILRPLRELDQVAYLRFASVYHAFDSLEDFEKEITELRARHLPGGTPPLPGMQPDLPAP